MSKVSKEQHKHDNKSSDLPTLVRLTGSSVEFRFRCYTFFKIMVSVTMETSKNDNFSYKRLWVFLFVCFLPQRGNIHDFTDILTLLQL